MRHYLQSNEHMTAWLDITKGRDGTIRKLIPITAYYDKLTICEGFFGNGNNEAPTGKEKETDAREQDNDDLESIYRDTVDAGAMQKSSSTRADGDEENAD